MFFSEFRDFSEFSKRDAILYITVEEKTKLFTNFFKWLKPGGKILVTDFTCNSDRNNWNPRMKTFVENRKYFLLSVLEYGLAFEKAGFKEVSAHSISNQHLELLQRELANFNSSKTDFIQVFYFAILRPEEGLFRSVKSYH